MDNGQPYGYDAGVREYYNKKALKKEQLNPFVNGCISEIVGEYDLVAIYKNKINNKKAYLIEYAQGYKMEIGYMVEETNGAFCVSFPISELPIENWEELE